MTEDDAERLRQQIQSLNFEQMRLLMRWIYLEFAHRCEIEVESWRRRR